MSAGSFSTTKYEADSGAIHQIVVQPEVVEATIGGEENTAPTGDVDSLFAAESSRSAKAYGLRPRKFRVAFTDSPPTGYRPYTTLAFPCLTPELFSEATLESDVSYNGATGKLKGKVVEDVNPGQSALGGGTEEVEPETP